MTGDPLQFMRRSIAVISRLRSRPDSPTPSLLVRGNVFCGMRGGEFPGTIAAEIHSATMAAGKFRRQLRMADSQIWHTRFMGLCDHVSEWSEDPHFRVGCVIVDARHVVLSTGYNGFPRGVQGHDPRRFNRKSGEKFFWFEHAERNAIYNAASVGVSLSEATLYVNRFPCADCSRAIIQSGIGALICPPIPEADGALDDSFRAGATMLEEAGLPITIFSLTERDE